MVLPRGAVMYVIIICNTNSQTSMNNAFQLTFSIDTRMCHIYCYTSIGIMLNTT